MAETIDPLEALLDLAMSAALEIALGEELCQELLRRVYAVCRQRGVQFPADGKKRLGALVAHCIEPPLPLSMVRRAYHAL
jgi:hypothetical protein